MRRLINVLGIFAIIATTCISAAGALNYSVSNGEYIYAVFGVANLVLGVGVAYQWAKSRKIL